MQRRDCLSHSDGLMDSHEEVEHILHTLQQNFPVVNVNVELPLHCIMHKNARLYVHRVTLAVPVRLERDRYTIPPVRIYVPQPISHCLHDPFRQHVRLRNEKNRVPLG